MNSHTVNIKPYRSLFLNARLHVLINYVYIERFSTKCRKTKTKVITLTNHSRHKQHNEPIRTRSKYTLVTVTMRVRRVYDRSALFLLWFALCWTNQPFLNRRHCRSCESTNWPGKYDSRLNFLPPRRDFFNPPLHVRSTHETAGILLHSTCNYSSKDVLFTTSIPHGWTDNYAISDSFLHRNLSKRRRMERHKRPCFYYPNSSAAFNMDYLVI